MTERHLDPTFVFAFAIYGSLVAGLVIARIVRWAVCRNESHERTTWLALKLIGIAESVVGFVAVAFLAFFLATVVWSMKGLVVEPVRLLILGPDEPKVILMACIAASVGAWTIRFIVRRINRHDDPQFAFLPDDTDDS
jgi:hypothetical protein